MSAKKSKSGDGDSHTPKQTVSEPAMEKLVSALDMAEAPHKNPENADLHAQLNSETGVLAWSELVKFFARGVVVKVASELDLVDVGHCFATDDSKRLESWLEKTLVARASDDDARDWTRREPEFWTLVAAPWVLVQEVTPKTTEPGAEEPRVH